MTYSIRQAEDKDASALAELTALLGYPPAKEAMASRLRTITASSSDCLIVAVDSEDQPIGWLQAHASVIIESGSRVEIVGMVVADEFRRKGVGRALVNAAAQWASEVHALALVVRSNVNRPESHAFYIALGFSRTKTQEVYRRPIV